MNVLNVFKVVYITTAFDRHNGTVESRSYMGKKLAIMYLPLQIFVSLPSAPDLR